MPPRAQRRCPVAAHAAPRPARDDHGGGRLDLRRQTRIGEQRTGRLRGEPRALEHGATERPDELEVVPAQRVGDAPRATLPATGRRPGGEVGAQAFLRGGPKIADARRLAELPAAPPVRLGEHERLERPVGGALDLGEDRGESVADEVAVAALGAPTRHREPEHRRAVILAGAGDGIREPPVRTLNQRPPSGDLVREAVGAHREIPRRDGRRRRGARGGRDLPGGGRCGCGRQRSEQDAAAKGCRAATGHARTVEARPHAARRSQGSGAVRRGSYPRAGIGLAPESRQRARGTPRSRRARPHGRPSRRS